MNGTSWARLGAISGGLAVIAGTFGAHVLEDRVEPDDLETFEIGVRYQMYHALALLAVGLIAIRTGPTRAVAVSGWSMLLGSILFPGSLYLLALAGGTADWLGMVAPIGGIAFIVGWFAMASAARGLATPVKWSMEAEASPGVPAEDPRHVV